MPKLKRSLLLKLKKNSRKVLRTGFTNKDADEQWVTDLIKVQTLAKQNKGYRYILVVTDAFFKYAWAQSIKKETGKDVSDSFAEILKEVQGRKP